LTAQIPGLTGEQIGALEMLTGCPGGCTESELKAKGFTIGLLGGLIRAGFATAMPGVVKAGDRTIGVVRLAITEKAPALCAWIPRPKSHQRLRHEQGYGKLRGRRSR
jgi:hypothetical protein